jgi:hypothetical protein
MSEFVTADPQQGIWRILKPAVGFEALFQGELAVQRPETGNRSEKIPFFEWKDRKPPNVRDPLAGKHGFDPNLLAYVNVRPNAQLVFAFPYLPVANQSTPNYYRYYLLFRQSNLARYNQLAGSQEQGGYSIPFESPGQPDTGAVGDTTRFVMMAGTESVAIHQPEPSPVTGVLQVTDGNNLNLRTEVVVVIPEPVQPLIIGAGPVRGIHQQGVLDPAAFPFGNDAAFCFYSTISKGDQLLVCADRFPQPAVGPEPDLWQFNGNVIPALAQTDSVFSNYYGTGVDFNVHEPVPEAGIYMAMSTP